MATLFLTLVLLKYESTFSFCTNNQLTYSYFYLALCGFLMSIGVVVPGVSSTVILMLLGIYPIYLESVSFFKLLLSNLKDKYMQIKNNKIELTPVKSRLIPGYKIKIEPITNPIIEKNVGI